MLLHALLNDYLSKRDCDVISFRYYKDYLKYKTIQTDNIDIKDKKQYPLINTSACTKIFKSDFYIKNNFEKTILKSTYKNKKKLLKIF